MMEVKYTAEVVKTGKKVEKKERRREEWEVKVFKNFRLEK